VIFVNSIFYLPDRLQRERILSANMIALLKVVTVIKSERITEYIIKKPLKTGCLSSHKRRGYYFCLLFPILFMLGVASAQQTGIHFINFNNKEGLSSSSVNAIIKDKYGYMWFATEDGLNKFDGVNFTVYRHNLTDTTTIGGNVISALFEDRWGNLWIGTNQSLSVYNRKKDAFINYRFMGNSATRAIAADHFGNLWVGGYFGLYKLNYSISKTENTQLAGVKFERLMTNTVLSIFEDSRQRIWIGTNMGLFHSKENGRGFVKDIHLTAGETVTIENAVRAITEDSNKNLWIGTNNGMSELMADGTGFKNYTLSNTGANSSGGNSIYALHTDQAGQLWIGTEDGLNIFDLKSETLMKIQSDKRNKYSLVGRSVRSIFIDENGIYWLGTYQGGVSKYDRNLAFFNLKESNAVDPFGLRSPFVTSFAEKSPGNIYVGTDGGGLNLFHVNTGLFEHPRLSSGPENNTLVILAMERVNDELWVATYQHGLYVLNIKSGTVRHHTKGLGTNDLPNTDIFCLKKDSRGNVWIGTNGNGVVVYNASTHTFDYPGKPATNGRTPISNWYCRTIEEDQFGNIWIGSNGAGIAVYNPSEKTFRIFNIENSNLPSNVVLSLHLDRAGNMWSGSLGGGLSIFENRTGKFISYSELQGLPNAVIYKILEDNLGKLWVSTNKGLSRFDPQTGRFKNYTYQNGLQRSAFSLGAGLKTNSGEMFFGGLDGFNYFDPLTLHSNRNVPSLQFTSLKISNKVVVPGDDEAISENISIAKEIRLDYKQNFSLDFIALNYTSPQDCRYAYKLDGFDRDWNLVGSLHSAVYTNLDPGEYTFRVKASSDDASWNTPEKTIRIFVKPPFWRTGYAYAIYALVAVTIVFLLRYQGMRKLKNKFALEQERLQVKQLIEQERMEAERQHEFDQLRIKFLTNLSHEFRTPISLIVGPVERLLQQEESSDKKSQLSMIRRNAGRLLNLVNQLLDFRKLDDNELKLNLAGGDIVLFTKEIGDSFKEIAEAKQISFNFSSSVSQYNTLFDRDKVERILLNLLSNAFKFTSRGGTIELKIEAGIESNLKIIVSDTGIGMSKEIQEKIFDRFFQADHSHDVLNQGSGIGLSIAKEFAKLHGGTIEVESQSARGSVFTVVLPCELISESANRIPMDVFETENKKLLSARHKKENGELQKFTVLLIEDNDDFRHYLRDSLSSYYKIIEASDGKEGWQKVLSSHPHVVVSDINMPVMDGITLSRKIKADKRTSHIPVLLLTAISGDANQLKGLETGAADYLTKPFNFEILNVKIKNLVSLNQNLKETYTRQINVVPSEVKVQFEDEKLMTKITQYIEANIDSPDLNVEELSKHAFMSRGSLYSKIVDMTGETPVEFIRSIKLKKAAVLLEKSDMKIAQIGYAVGFSSPNYFARAFKAKFNLSPSEYAIQKRGFANPDNISVD
jgi:signal transduction histidine kinase/ligand-binding sensor domain-containing protein/AraC-like DNA-binding protein